MVLDIYWNEYLDYYRAVINLINNMPNPEFDVQIVGDEVLINGVKKGEVKRLPKGRDQVPEVGAGRCLK